MINSKFSVAIHILSVIETTTDKAHLTSDWIASSVNTNPVVIRRLIGQLKKAGLITSHPGQSGYELIKKPIEIHLLDVYHAVIDKPLFSIHDQPNPQCIVGKNIQSTLTTVFDSVEQAMEEELAAETLQNILDKLLIK